VEQVLVYRHKSTNVRTEIARLLFAAVSRIAPRVAVRIAHPLFMTPPRRHPCPREQHWGATAQRGKVLTSSGGLSTLSWGEGSRTVLLVHGWGGSGLQLGELVGPLVERGFRVLTFDAPGHGSSPGRRSSLPAMAAALAAVAQQHDPVEAVVAHSLGAAATTLALGTGQLEVQRVVAVAPVARFAAIREYFASTTRFSAQVVEQLWQQLERQFGVSWADYEPLELARSQRASLLVIHDRDDLELPLSEGEAFAEAWPGGTLMTTVGLGHRRLLTDPEVIEQICRFLERNPDLLHRPDTAVPRDSVKAAPFHRYLSSPMR